MPSPSVVSQIRKLDLSLRQAACKDVLENLPVVLEGPLLPLENQGSFSDLLLDELRLKYDVSICRPFSQNKVDYLGQSRQSNYI
jgi:hypothetical protein